MNKNIIIGLAMFLLSIAAYATDYTWTGASDNNWSNTANWVEGTLPLVNSDGRLSGTGNRIILQDNALIMPNSNVPELSGFREGSMPTIIMGENTTASFVKYSRLGNSGGIDRAGEIATIGQHASLTLVRTNLNLVFSRDGSGEGRYAINGGTLNILIGSAASFREDQSRYSTFALSNGTLQISNPNGTLALYGTRNPNRDYSSSSPTTFTLDADSTVDLNGSFKGGMTGNNGNTTIQFDLMDTNSTLTFKLGGYFPDLDSVRSSFGKTFTSSTFGTSSLQATDAGGGEVSVTTIPEPAALSFIGFLSATFLFIHRRFIKG
jgi:hypothetical protein